MSVEEMINLLEGHSGIQSSQTRKQSKLIADKLRSMSAAIQAADDLADQILNSESMNPELGLAKEYVKLREKV